MVKSVMVLLLVSGLISCVSSEKKDTALDLPLLHIQPSVYVLGEVKEGEEATATFLIRNNTAQTMMLTDIQASCGCTAAAPDSYVIPAFGFTQLKVSVDTTAKQQHIKKAIHITNASGHHASAELVFSVVENPHFVPEGKPKGIFDKACASCHYEPAANKTAGKQIYDAVCLMCHGVDGQGAYAPKLSGYASFKALKHIITNGVGKPQMPAFSHERGGPLKEAQIEAVSEWLMGLPAP